MTTLQGDCSIKSIWTPRAEEAATLGATALRQNFLLDDLFEPGRLTLAISDLDRMIAGGAMPQGELRLPALQELGTRYFTERREVGVMNIGDPGSVRAGAQTFVLDSLDCLYIGTGEEDVTFANGPSGQAAFYVLSCPAHQKHPTAKISRANVSAEALGDDVHASKRCLRKYIHPDGLRSCQLMMGCTELAPGSVWNTMPAHTHARRSEIYLYFNLADGIVVHLMGRPDETRHLMVRDRQAVLSPSWSMHAGAGTRNYSFIWGMAGENQDFSDMDAVLSGDLR